MSTEKYDPAVTIRRSQWEAMNRQCRQAEETVQNEQRERDRQVAAARQEAQQRMATLQNQYTSRITGLSNEMREVERKQNEVFSNALERQGAEIRREMQQQRTELVGIINTVEQRLIAERQGKRERAELWANQPEAFIKEIENYRHDLFFPNKLQERIIALQQAQNNIAAGDFEAAISSAQICFNEAVGLRAEVIAAEVEWERAFRSLSERAAYLNSCINDAKLLEFTFGTETVPAEVNFWTNGRLAAVENEFLPFKQIVSKPDNATIADLVRACTALDNMRDAHFPNPDSEGNVSGGIINSAKEMLLLSAYRADLVNDVASAMVKEGWEVEDYGYRGNDKRDELHVKIIDGTGNEMVAIVAPGMAQSGALTNSLNLNFFNDKQLNTDIIDGLIRNIHQVLQANGIETNMRCTPGTENSQSTRQELRNIRQTVSGKG